MIVGVLTFGVAVWQLFCIWRNRKIAKKEDICLGKPNVTTVEVELPEKVEVPSLGFENDATECTELLSHDGNQSVPLEFDGRSFESTHSDKARTFSGILTDCCTGLKHELWPIRPVIICMILAGFFGGFFGGLISVGGPPLIAFFFFFEFPKAQVRANGTVIDTVGDLVRLVTYALTSPPASYPYSSWFSAEDWMLYVVLVVSGVLVVPIGVYLTKYLDNAGYKVALAALLVINGITMITTASITMANQN